YNGVYSKESQEKTVLPYPLFWVLDFGLSIIIIFQSLLVIIYVLVFSFFARLIFFSLFYYASI
ncbi:MAG: hypothetical protein KDC52_02400, partial [Ignavibacteriae bacterium]|nr:hypothetical protein [Ignavibacteriota bacterium]